MGRSRTKWCRQCITDTTVTSRRPCDKLHASFTELDKNSLQHFATLHKIDTLTIPSPRPPPQSPHTRLHLHPSHRHPHNGLLVGMEDASRITRCYSHTDKDAQVHSLTNKQSNNNQSNKHTTNPHTNPLHHTVFHIFMWHLHDIYPTTFTAFLTFLRFPFSLVFQSHTISQPQPRML